MVAPRVYGSAGEVPAVEVTVIGADPAEPAGTDATIVVSLTTV